MRQGFELLFTPYQSPKVGFGKAEKTLAEQKLGTKICLFKSYTVTIETLQDCKCCMRSYWMLLLCPFAGVPQGSVLKVQLLFHPQGSRAFRHQMTTAFSVLGNGLNCPTPSELLRPEPAIFVPFPSCTS